MRKSIAGFLLMVAVTMAAPYVPAAYAKTNCGAVMQELTTGKKPKQVALDMSISTSSVYRCRHLSKMHAAKAAAGMSGEPPTTMAATPPATH